MPNEAEKICLPFLPIRPDHPALDNAPALFDDSSAEWFSYGALRQVIRQNLAFFKAPQRELVFCCINQSIAGVSAYLTAATAGHAVAMINPTLAHIDRIAKTYQPRWIIFPDKREIAGYRRRRGFIKGYALLESESSFNALLHPDFYLMLLTSGSTGSHKGVRLSYSNMAANCTAIIDSLSMTSKDRPLAHLPLSYSFGLSVLHTTLATGGSCLLSEQSMMSSALWKKARSEKVSLFPGVPYHYEMLLRLGLDRLNVPSLKTFIQAGGKMNLETTQQMLAASQARKARLFIMYGQTEAAPRISCFPLHQYPDKIGSAGRALKGGKLSVEEDEIVYQGPNVMLGYATTRHDLSKGDLSQGRLVTGDMGKIDEQGFLFLTGRKQRIAKLFGQRFSMDDLEHLASKTAPTAVVEAPDKLLFYTTAQKESLIKQMKTIISLETKMPPTWFDVIFIDALPHLANGKIDYAKLKSLVPS